LNPQLSAITIRNLLNHTGGWNLDTEAVRNPTDDSIQIAVALGEPGPVSANDTIRYMLDKPTTYSPGTTYCYSNFGYAVLGAIIEQVTGTAYPTWTKQRVLAPRGVTDMAIGGSLRSDVAPEEVTYYDYPNAPLYSSIFPSVPGPVPATYGAVNLQAGAACGGWIASPVDMLRFAGGIDAYVGSPSLISSSSLSQMLTNPNVPTCNPDGTTTPASSASWYGFGFFVDQSGNYSHGGSLPGTATKDAIGKNGFNVAILFNSLPQNASQFIWVDLDQALSTAFNATGTWSSEDYFDQFGAFSDWHSPSAFAADGLAAQAAGKYPTRVEGRLNGGSPEFRGEFVPLHSLTQVQSSAGLDCVSYRALADQYKKSGLGLVSLQTFVDAAGAMRYQATWKSF
jgi:N-acyl-D-amino-acid deacylase